MTHDPAVPAAHYDTIAQFEDYTQAQALVDRLSDGGFDVSTVKIVGEGLRSEEYVTGRMTKGRAALAGAGSGLWFGLFLGILFGIFAPGFGWLGIIVWSLIIGAVWGAIFGFVAHALTGGRRDFASMKTMSADHYAVQVQREHAGRALEFVNR